MKDECGNKELSHGRSLLIDFLSENGFGSEIIQKFDALTDIYFNFNSMINISALKTLDDVYIKHYLDSIYPYKLFDGECCDVGCGGGFPCIPLSIVTNNSYLGIDGVGKKLKMIELCKTQLGLNNISAMHVRSTDLVNRKSFDTVCARAVADTQTVLSYCSPLAKSGGKIILYKTQNDERANQSTENKNKVKLSDIIDFVLPGTDINRRLFVYSKL